MPQTATPIAFPSWRDRWTELEGLAPLLAEADKALRRRAKGNHRLPPKPNLDGPEAGTAVLAMRAWANGGPPKNASDRPLIARRIRHNLRSVWPAVQWPRWLFLEQAFLDGSASGDLPFAALTLRTMCEEVQRLHALDLSSEKLAALAASDRKEDRNRLQTYFSVAWTSLARLADDMVWEGKGWPSLNELNAERPELKAAVAALNGYVHPNYGSHITALFPERTEAARLLLEATAVVYRSFFGLSWAESSTSPGGALPKLAPSEPWPLTLRRFTETTLPTLRGSAKHRAESEVFKAPHVLEWLGTNRSDIDEMLAQPQIAALIADLLRRDPSVLEAPGAGNYVLWEGACAGDLLDLAAARRAEQILSEAAPAGAPGSDDQTRWLRFNRLSLELAMLLDLTKANAFKIQMVRQIARGNDLGALLCVRSLVEHRAMAVWLPDAVGRSLNDLAGQVRAKEPLPDLEAANLEQKIANFLTAQAKGSQEVRHPWVVDEDGEVRKAWLNLGTVVRAAFPEDDRFRRIYALTSAAIHGRVSRGIDLLESEAAGELAAGLGVIVLERLCDPDESMSPTFAAAMVAIQLGHAERFGASNEAATDRLAQQVLGRIDQAIVQGVDYTGEGTAQDPYRIAAHLQFHAASYALLAQFGVDLAEGRRELTPDGRGGLCDRWTSQDREIWFHVELPTT